MKFYVLRVLCLARTLKLRDEVEGAAVVPISCTNLYPCMNRRWSWFVGQQDSSYKRFGGAGMFLFTS